MTRRYFNGFNVISDFDAPGHRSDVPIESKSGLNVFEC